MPSFDIVSKVDNHELTNAVDQANRELKNRFDFKGVDANFDLAENVITMTAPSDFQVQQMADILQSKLTKRNLDIRSLDFQPMETALHQAKQVVNVKQGIDKEAAKKIIKLVKESKIKVQASIQGEQVRINGKNRDDLQQVIALMKESDLGLPLAYENFRD